MRVWGLLVLVVVTPGCTSAQLRRSTVSQASTLSELQYQQVLDNLAMFAVNRSAIPWHLAIRDGSSQIADLGSASLVGAFGRSMGALGTGSPSVTGSRTDVQQWGTIPVTDDTELHLLQIAYRRALGSTENLERSEFSDKPNDFANELAHELKKQVAVSDDFRESNDLVVERQRVEARRFVQTHPSVDLYDRLDETTISSNDERIIFENESVASPDFDPAKANIPSKTSVDPIPRFVYARPTAVTREVRRLVKETARDLEAIEPLWFGVGCDRSEVPADACYVGHAKDRCGERFVWVCPAQRSSLGEFTLTILNLSTLIKDPQLVATAGGPRIAPASAYITPTR